MLHHISSILRREGLILQGNICASASMSMDSKMFYTWISNTINKPHTIVIKTRQTLTLWQLQYSVSTFLFIKFHKKAIHHWRIRFSTPNTGLTQFEGVKHITVWPCSCENREEKCWEHFQMFKLKAVIRIKKKKKTHDILASWSIAILKSKLSHIRWCNVLISLGYKTCLIYLGFQGMWLLFLKVILNITLL